MISYGVLVRSFVYGEEEMQMERKWWHDKIVYQVYPKSFYDTNQDGIGDIKGVTAKLDYLKDLGIDIIWLSPVYQSPLADEGYDISDYYSIDPRFGTMEDMEELIAEAKKRDMSILMDLVVNHCSDEHEWFRKACSKPDGEFGKYFYIRKKGENGELPTNWRSYFGGPAWDELPGHPDLVYLHVFHRKQPDLNWENASVREEVYRNINWWLDKGLGGFRIDAIINIKKPAVLRSYPPDREDGYSSLTSMLEDASGIGVFLSEMKERTFSRYDAFTVGEVVGEKAEEVPDFIGEDGYFSSMFDFEEDHFGNSPKGWYDRIPCLPEDYKKCVFRIQSRIGTMGFLSNIIENHDQPRGVSRYIPAGELGSVSKKALACAYFLLRGIPFIYQGQEIGMENKTFHSEEEMLDVGSLDQFRTAMDAGCSREEAFAVISRYSRDNARTPMQWSDEPHAGFTKGIPWQKENENYTAVNVKENLADPDSVWHFYQKLIALRKDPVYRDTFVYGEFEPYLPEVKNLMAYRRMSVEPGTVSALTQSTPEVLVAVNMQQTPLRVEVPEPFRKILLSNLPDVAIRGTELTLAPWQAVVLGSSEAN